VKDLVTIFIALNKNNSYINRYMIHMSYRRYYSNKAYLLIKLSSCGFIRWSTSCLSMLCIFMKVIFLLELCNPPVRCSILRSIAKLIAFFFKTAPVISRLQDNASLAQLHKAHSTFSYFEGRLRFNWAVYSSESVVSHFSFAIKTAETIFLLVLYFDASSPFVGVGFFVHLLKIFF